MHPDNDELADFFYINTEHGESDPVSDFIGCLNWIVNNRAGRDASFEVASAVVDYLDSNELSYKDFALQHGLPVEYVRNCLTGKLLNKEEQEYFKNLIKK